MINAVFPFSKRFSHRRFQTLRYSAQQSRLLRRVVNRIRHSLDLEVVLQTAVDEMAALLHLDHCLFFWFVPAKDRVQVVCEKQRNSTKSYLGQYSLSTFEAIAPSLQTGELIVHEGLHSRKRTTTWDWIKSLIAPTQKPSSEELTLLDARAYLLVPVQGLEETTGFLACLSRSPRQWHEKDLDFIDAVSQQLEIAVRQAQLYATVQKQARREKLVNQITTQTRQSLDLQTILKQAIAQLREALDCDRSLVHLVEESLSEDFLNPATASQFFQGNGSTTHNGNGKGHSNSASDDHCDEMNNAIILNNGNGSNHYGGDRQFHQRHLLEVCREGIAPSIQDFNINGPITQWVIQHRQSVVITDVLKDARIGTDNIEYQRAQIRSSLVVPVQANGILLAILYLNQCEAMREWSKEDEKLAQAVADQLAISIQQAHLYAQTQQQVREQAAQAAYLSATLKNLRAMQAQVIQSEKMSSLGQIVGGVAHEINNPISFIYGNIPYIEQYIRGLVKLLESYQTHYPQGQIELATLMQEVDLEFVLQDLPRILTSMKAGSSRIRDIVSGLQRFSGLDEERCQLVDVHQLLENALNMLDSQLPPTLQVIREYAPAAQLEGYPRLLTQVFLNLIRNAIEAMNRVEDRPQILKLRTESHFDESNGILWLRVAIADTGCGIPEAIQSKIFDPFFTTKPVGEGIGLGLAICYQTIVNQHQGHLKVCSTLGEGTEFILELPLYRSSLVPQPPPWATAPAQSATNAGSPTFSIY